MIESRRSSGFTASTGGEGDSVRYPSPSRTTLVISGSLSTRKGLPESRDILSRPGGRSNDLPTDLGRYVLEAMRLKWWPSSSSGESRDNRSSGNAVVEVLLIPLAALTILGVRRSFSCDRSQVSELLRVRMRGAWCSGGDRGRSRFGLDLWSDSARTALCDRIVRSYACRHSKQLGTARICPCRSVFELVAIADSSQVRHWRTGCLPQDAAENWCVLGILGAGKVDSGRYCCPLTKLKIRTAVAARTLAHQDRATDCHRHHPC